MLRHVGDPVCCLLTLLYKGFGYLPPALVRVVYVCGAVCVWMGVMIIW